jgi:SAM-dependent methyltransferase
VKEILRNVNSYYTEKVLKHGPSPHGADWRNEESQLARFVQLLKLVKNTATDFSINDLGCGYGKLYEFLNENYDSFSYTGYDLSEEMISNALRLYGNSGSHDFRAIGDLDELTPADFTVTSGIFNVMMGHSADEWQDYFLTVLRQMDRVSKSGFAFNCLTIYSDKEYMKDNLYYADPCFYFDYCKKHFSRNVALLHDYDLYEFTILVTKG